MADQTLLRLERNRRAAEAHDVVVVEGLGRQGLAPHPRHVHGANRAFQAMAAKMPHVEDEMEIWAATVQRAHRDWNPKAAAEYR